MANIGTVVAGIVLLLLGLILTATIIGAILGIPLLIIGFILIIVGAASSSTNPQPVYYPVPPVYLPPPPSASPATPVYVNVHPAPSAPAPPQIMRRCRYCQTVFPEASSKCPRCGAAF